MTQPLEQARRSGPAQKRGDQPSASYEFPSFEEAMANSELPETSEVAARLAELCDGSPTFRNLEFRRDLTMGEQPRRSARAGWSWSARRPPEPDGRRGT
jgi:hypothetical protein